MLRGRALGVATLALGLGLALWAKPVLAQVDGENFTPGSGCPAGAVTGQAASASWDTIFECNGSTKWQRGPYFFGSSSDTCDSNHAGLTYYNSTSAVLEYCNGTTWQTLNGAGTGGITPGCGASGTLSSQQQTTLNVATGCHVLFKVWGAGGGQSQAEANGEASGNGGGGGYATITLGPLGSAMTYYLNVGGGGGGNTCSSAASAGGGLTGYTGGQGGAGTNYPYGCYGGSGGSASGIWTGSYGGTAVLVAAGGGGGGSGGDYAVGLNGYAGGGGGTQNGAATGGTGSAATGGYTGGSGGGGAGYTTGGAGGLAQSLSYQGGYGGYGGTNYAASGGTTAAGSNATPGDAGDANLPTNGGYGATSAANGYDGAIYYSTY